MTPPPTVPAPQVEMLMRTTVGERQWIATIETAPEPTGHVVQIRCLSGCGDAKVFTDDEGDIPLSLFRLSDAGPLIYSIWATGSAYRIKVYDAGREPVRQVLDAASLGGPDLVTDAKGREVVRTSERRDGAGPRSPLLHVDWTWNGRSFTRR